MVLLFLDIKEQAGIQHRGFDIKMATSDRLSRLFQAIAARDWDRANSIAAQICVEKEKMGQRTAARLLRGSLQSHGSTNGDLARTTESAFPIDAALTRVTNDTALGDVELKLRQRKELCSIVKEWKHRDVLEERGLQPRNKLFLHGPPGCGKSLSACALGTELGLPTYIVRFDAIIGAYLGQTAIHLRQLFHFAETTSCVLVLDELDALGKKRGNPLDVGELDRIVIALMQELEHARPLGLIVATSNLPKHLDEALWRRFDAAIELPSPTGNELEKYANALAKVHGVKVSLQLRKKIAAASSYAEAEKLIQAQARQDALKNF